MRFAWFITMSGTGSARSGYEISLMPGICRLVMWMSDQSRTCQGMTYGDTGRCTCSQGLVGGGWPPVYPAGQLLENCGPGAVPASDSQARRGGGIRRGMGGPRCDDSSLSAVLQRWLGSRLPVLGGGYRGSAGIWLNWDMSVPGWCYRLTVLGTTIREHGCILRATPTATANQGAPSMRKHSGCRNLEVSPEAWRERMGFPVAWRNCVPTGMRSSQPSGLKSSGRSLRADRDEP